VKHTEPLLAAQEIVVDITDWALAAGTKRPSTQQSHGDDVSNDFMKGEDFWNSSERSGSETPKTIPPSRASTFERRTQTASYTVYSAEVTTNQNENLRKDLKLMTKKDLPSRFRSELVYVSLPSSVIVSPALIIDAVLQRATRCKSSRGEERYNRECIQGTSRSISSTRRVLFFSPIRAHVCHVIFIVIGNTCPGSSS